MKKGKNKEKVQDLEEEMEELKQKRVAMVEQAESHLKTLTNKRKERLIQL